jgi:hypothetical protein
VDHNFFAPAYRRQVSASLREEKKRMARKVGKPQRPPEVKPSKPQFLCACLPQAGLCAFARIKKKNSSQSRKAAKATRSQTEWNHLRLEMIKNQIKVWLNPKARLYYI